MNEIDDDWVISRQKWDFYRHCHIKINAGKKCGEKQYNCKDRLRECFSHFEVLFKSKPILAFFQPEIVTKIESQYEAKTIKIPKNTGKPTVIDFGKKESVKNLPAEIKSSSFYRLTDTSHSRRREN